MKNVFIISIIFIILNHIKIIELKSVIFPIDFSSQLYITYLNFNVEQKEEFDLNNIFKYIFENKIISKIKIGNPEQEMMVIFSNEEKYFYLSKNPDIITDKFLYQFLNQGKFSKDLSSTFLLKNKIDYITKKYNIIHMGEDEIIFDNTKIKFQFFIENDNENEPIYFGIIGVGLDKNKDLLNYPKFINQIKDFGLINNYYWYINYEKNSLIIGEELDESNNYNYQYQEIFTKPYYDINEENILIMDWNILFDKIYMEEQYHNNNKLILHDNSSKAHGILDIDFGFIVGSPIYRIFLNEKYFDDLIEKNKCINKVYKSENKYKSDYYFYYCNKTFEKEIKEKFHTLKFESKELNYIFELNYNDLFININNNKNILFMIAFEVVNEETNYNTWILGEPFLKKYNFVFNPDKKTIVFKQRISEICDKKNNKIIIIITIVVFFFILLIIFRFIKKYRINLQIKNVKNDNHYLNTNKNIKIKKEIKKDKQTLELKDSLLFNSDNKEN